MSASTQSMKLITQLNESSTIPVHDLLKRMKKDPRVKFLFSRGASVDAIEDKEDFKSAIRFYIFGNTAVRDLLKQRVDSSGAELWKHGVANYIDAMKPGKVISQWTIDGLAAFIKNLVKTHDNQRQFKASGDAAQEIRNMIGGYHNHAISVRPHIAREIDALNFKPDTPVLLYRGLMFDENSMKDQDGMLGYRYGLEFLRSIREGSRTIDLTLDRYTGWTTSKKRAEIWALARQDAGWRDNLESRKIDRHRGELAFVISTLAKPEDILIDVSVYAEATGYPHEGSRDLDTVILKPTKILARVVSKFNRTGEVDPIYKGDKGETLDDLGEKLEFFSRLIKLPVVFDDGFIDFTPDIQRVMNGLPLETIKELLEPQKIEQITKLLNATISFYKKTIQPINWHDMADAAGSRTKQYAALKDLHELFDRIVTLKPAGRTKSESFRVHELTGEQVLNRWTYPSNVPELVGTISAQKRATGWQTTGVAKTIAKAADPNLQTPKDLHLRGWKEQKPVFDAARKVILSLAGEQPTSDHAADAKQIQQIIQRVCQVAGALSFLSQVKRIAASAAQ